MSGYRSDVVTRFSLWASAIWLLTRFYEIQPGSTLLLSGEIVSSWIVVNIILICYGTLYKRHYSPFKTIPGPKSINWLYDHIFDIFDEPLAFNVTDWINEKAYPGGLLHFFGLFGSSYIVPTSAEALTEVLSTRAYDYEKASSFKRYTTRFWGHGLVSQEQEEHKRNRKNYLPVFNQTNINKLKPILFAKSMQFVDHISELCATHDAKHTTNPDSTVVSITKVTAMVSLDVTGIIALGIDFETILGKNHEIVEAHEMLFSSSKDKRLLFLLYNIAPRWVLDLLRFPVANKVDHAHSILANVCRQILRERVGQPGKSEAQALDFVENLGRSNLSDETNAIAQLVVIIGGGYESIGSTLAWVVYCLARHPEAQEDLRKELAEFCDGLGNLKADAEYDKLPVLNAVVMEATRLYPAFTLLFRKAIRDTMIGEQPIRKDTFVGMCPRAINYAHHLWGSDAAKFIPERWIDRSDPGSPRLDPLGGAPASICMLSYSYGTRSCVGRELALAQMKRQIALIVARFNVEPVDDYDPRPSGLFATGPPSDLLVRFTKLTVSYSLYSLLHDCYESKYR